MQMRRRTFLGALAASGAAAGLSACGGSSSSGSSTPLGASGASSSLTGTLTVMTPDYQGEPGRAVLEDKIIKAFVDKHPGVKVTVDYPGWSNISQKVAAGLAGGTLTDVVMVGAGWIPPLAQKGALLELSNDLLGSNKIEPAILSACKYNDKLYALPDILAPLTLLYRKDLLKAAGYSEPPKGLDAFRDMCKKLTSANGAPGGKKRYAIDLYSNNPRQVFAAFLGAQGGTFFSEDGKKPTFNDDKGQAALQLMVDLIKDGSTGLDVKTIEGQGTPYERDIAAMGMYLPTAWKGLTAAAPKIANTDTTGFFNITGTKSAMFTGGTLAAVYSKTKVPQLAAAFVAHLAEPDSINQTAVLQQSLPVYSETLPSGLADNPIVKFEQQHLSDAVYEGGSPAWMDVRSNFQPTFEDCLSGKTTVKDCLDTLAKQATDAIARIR